MIISKNLQPTIEEFEILCKYTALELNKKAALEPTYYLSKGAQKLEPEVKIVMDFVSKGTVFENTIEIVGGQKFPDIVAAKLYGVEVKSTKVDQWTIIGGSLAEGTRVADVNNIFLMFGKLFNPVEFRTRRYQDCLYDIAVTHSPRYKIDMNLPKHKTIFDKMGIEYDDLRKMENPIAPVVDYFRKTLKIGESLWWVNGENFEESSVPIKIKLFSSLGIEEKHNIRVQIMMRFPEIFGNSSRKYERCSLWLVAKYGIVSTSMRDLFSAGGKIDLNIDGYFYRKIPKIYEHVYVNIDVICQELYYMDLVEIANLWNVSAKDIDNVIKMWILLVCKNAIPNCDFDVENMFHGMFFQQYQRGKNVGMPKLILNETTEYEKSKVAESLKN